MSPMFLIMPCSSSDNFLSSSFNLDDTKQNQTSNKQTWLSPKAKVINMKTTLQHLNGQSLSPAVIPVCYPQLEILQPSISYRKDSDENMR